MKHWTTYSIKDVCRIIGGNPAPKGDDAFDVEGIPFVKMKDLGKYHITDNLTDIENKVNKKVAARNSLKIVKKGSILLPRSGSVALNHRAVLGVDAYMVSHICALEIIDAQKVYNIFLYYLLRRMKMDKITKKTTGLDAITFQDLGNIVIKLPPLFYQYRIATVLSKTEALIAQRKESLHFLDELLRSTFLEMFGDPVNNTKGWDKPYLRSFGDISTGNTPPRSNKENYSSDYIEWIKTDNILDSEMYVTPAFEYLSEFGASKARIVTSGALLVTCIAGSIKSIGGVALTNRTIAFNQQINAIQPYEDVSPLFIYWLFKVSRDYVRNVASKGMKKIITKSTFEDIRMIKPPYDIQEKFAAIVEKVETLKTLYHTSLAELKDLYGSLSQRAFKGELDLSRVEVEMPDTATRIETSGAVHVHDRRERKPKTVREEKTGGFSQYYHELIGLIKDHLLPFDFRFQELLSLLENRTQLLKYLTSDELKRTKLDNEEDLKSFIFDCIEGKIEQLKIEQFFYNALEDMELAGIRLKEGSEEMTRRVKAKKLSLEDLNGIYFRIVS